MFFEKISNEDYTKLIRYINEVHTRIHKLFYKLFDIHYKPTEIYYNCWTLYEEKMILINNKLINIEGLDVNELVDPKIIREIDLIYSNNQDDIDKILYNRVINIIESIIEKLDYLIAYINIIYD